MTKHENTMARWKAGRATEILEELNSEQQAFAVRAIVRDLHVEIVDNRIVALNPITDEEKKRWGI